MPRLHHITINWSFYPVTWYSRQYVLGRNATHLCSLVCRCKRTSRSCSRRLLCSGKAEKRTHSPRSHSVCPESPARSSRQSHRPCPCTKPCPGRGSARRPLPHHTSWQRTVGPTRHRRPPILRAGTGTAALRSWR